MGSSATEVSPYLTVSAGKRWRQAASWVDDDARGGVTAGEVLHEGAAGHCAGRHCLRSEHSPCVKGEGRAGDLPSMITSARRTYRRSGITDMRAALAEGGLQHEPRRPESWRSSNDAQNDLPCFMPSIRATSYAPCSEFICSTIALLLLHCHCLLSGPQCASKPVLRVLKSTRVFTRAQALARESNSRWLHA